MFFFVSQVLSVRHTNQTSKNVADTIFKKAIKKISHKILLDDNMKKCQ